MKKTSVLVLALGIGLFFACKKKEDKKEEAPASTSTTGGTTTGGTPTVTPVFTDGLKLEDNLGNVYLSDSAEMVLKPSAGIRQITSYRGKVANTYADRNVILNFKTKTIQAKTYPIDSLDLDECYFFTGTIPNIEQYEAVSGSVTISALTSTKASGSFNFVVTPRNGSTATRTTLKGTLNNIKVKS